MMNLVRWMMSAIAHTRAVGPAVAPEGVIPDGFDGFGGFGGQLL